MWIYCLSGSGILLQAQEFGFASGGVPAGATDGTNHIFRTAGPGQAGFVINGLDFGSVLLKACDLNQDGKATLAEVKEVASACFKLWDTNADGNLSQTELGAGLKALFPAPPPGAGYGVRMINGVATPVSPDELPTPDSQLAKHLFAGADANKGGSLSLQEINDFLAKNFSQWDQDSSSSLDAGEFALAFGQLTLPDGAATSRVPSP